MRHLAQARNPYSLSWLWIPGSLALLAPRNDGRWRYLPPCHSLVNSAISAVAASRMAEGVREKRGAGAGWVTPWRGAENYRVGRGGGVWPPWLRQGRVQAT